MIEGFVAVRNRQAENMESAGGAQPGRKEGIDAVHMVLDLLEHLAAAENGGGITELAAKLNTSKARIYRYLQTLRSRGYVTDRSERYHVGIKLYLLGQAIGDRFDLVRATQVPAERLRDEIGLTVTVMTPLDGKLVCVGLWRGRTPVEISLLLGAKFPLHSTSGGKLALAYGSPGIAPDAIEGPHQRFTEHTIIDPRKLRLEVEACRRRGWATAANETLPGLNALAAPIFDHEGTFVGSIAVVGSTQIVPPKPDAHMIQAVMTAARAVSRELGWLG